MLRPLKMAWMIAPLFMLLTPVRAVAEVVVIVNPQSGIEMMTKTEVINVFMGRYRQLANGVVAKPVDMPTGSGEKIQFYRILVNKDIDQLAAYWSRFVFAGSTAPPHQATSTEEVIRYVAANRGAVGYIDKASADARIRVVPVIE